VNTPSIGQPLDRIDGWLKVTGGARYSAEIPVSGVVHGVLIRSTIANGRVAAMDIAAAEKLPGVLAVLTPFNAPRLPDKPGGVNDPRGGRRISVLQNDRVFYYNQPIGVALAETFERAVHAAELVNVRYDEQPPLVDLLSNESRAYAPRPPISRDRPVDQSRGDAASALADAAARVETTYFEPVENHNPMEPHATTAVWETPERLTVYDATQGIHNTRHRLANIFGLPPDHVRVICYFLGGGFGSKGPVWEHTALAALCAQKLGRPVKIALSRQGMFNNTGFRPELYQRIAFGADADGRLVAQRHECLQHNSMIDEFVESASVVTRMLNKYPHNYSSHRLVRLNIGTPSYMRAPGEASGTFALEGGMDELAYELKIDPVEFRLRNHADTDPSENDKPWSSKHLKECYQLGAEKFGWAKHNPHPRSMRTADGRWLVGYGMATASYPTRRSPSSAVARLLADGTALVQAGTQDLGTGTYTIMTQIAADALGLPVWKIRFELGDTLFPETPGSGGSQTAASTGSAVFNACTALKQRLVELAVNDLRSPLHGKSPGDVNVVNGRIQLVDFSVNGGSEPRQDNWIGETFADVVQRTGQPFVEVKADFKPANGEKFSMHSFGAQFCEVHVDSDLGRIRVARWTGVFAPGKILNAKTARSQLIGGIIYGIGMALLEETVYDKRDGRIVNPNLAEYHVPVNADVPQMEIAFVEEEDPHINPIGVKGIGEIGITGVCAALANAVFHATGKRVRELPITLDKLLG